jgi:hypothetical protein
MKRCGAALPSNAILNGYIANMDVPDQPHFVFWLAQSVSAVPMEFLPRHLAFTVGRHQLDVAHAKCFRQFV